VLNHLTGQDNAALREPQPGLPGAMHDAQDVPVDRVDDREAGTQPGMRARPMAAAGVDGCVRAGAASNARTRGRSRVRRQGGPHDDVGLRESARRRRLWANVIMWMTAT